MPKARSKTASLTKDTKLQIRLRPLQKQLITRAARIRKITVSTFLLDNACIAAEHVLADRAQFTLPPDRWEEFCAALDAPPRKLTPLRNLLSEPGVFDANPATR